MSQRKETDGRRKTFNKVRRERFAENVRLLCQRRGLSLKDAAKQIDIDYPLLRRWASSGISKLDRRTTGQLEKLLAFFDIPSKDLHLMWRWSGFFDRRAREFGERAHRLYRAFNSKFPPKPPTLGSAPESMMLQRGDDRDKWRLFILLADYFDKGLTKEQAKLEADDE